jgi:hypothetical protein
MAERARYRPWLPVTVNADNSDPATDLVIRKVDCVALQAVWAGVANEDQQKRAILTMMHICGVNDLEYLPDEHGGERDSTFKSGKRHVGLQLRKLVSFPISILTGEENDGPAHSRSSGKPADARNATRAKR